MAKARDIEEAMSREIAAWPGVRTSFERSGRHPAMVLEFHGRRRRYHYSGTPSDRRSARNHQSDIRRVLRDIGATKGAAR